MSRKKGPVPKPRTTVRPHNFGEILCTGIVIILVLVFIENITHTIA